MTAPTHRSRAADQTDGPTARAPGVPPAPGAAATLLPLQGTAGNRAVRHVVQRDRDYRPPAPAAAGVQRDVGGTLGGGKAQIEHKVPPVETRFGKLELAYAYSEDLALETQWEVELGESLKAQLSASLGGDVTKLFRKGGLEWEAGGWKLKLALDVDFLDADLTFEEGEEPEASLSPVKAALKGTATPPGSPGNVSVTGTWTLSFDALDTLVRRGLSGAEQRAWKKLKKLDARRVALQQQADGIARRVERLAPQHNARVARLNELKRAARRTKGRPPKELRREIARLRRLTRQSERELKRLNREAKRVSRSLERLSRQIQRTARTGTGPAFRALAGGWLRTAGKVLTRALTRLAGVFGLLATVYDAVAVIRNLLKGRLFHGLWLDGDPWGEGVGEGGEGEPGEGEAEGTEEGTGSGGTVAGGGTGDGTEGSPDGGPVPEGTEGGQPEGTGGTEEAESEPAEGDAADVEEDGGGGGGRTEQSEDEGGGEPAAEDSGTTSVEEATDGDSGTEGEDAGGVTPRKRLQAWQFSVQNFRWDPKQRRGRRLALRIRFDHEGRERRSTIKVVLDVPPHRTGRGEEATPDTGETGCPTCGASPHPDTPLAIVVLRERWEFKTGKDTGLFMPEGDRITLIKE